MEGAKKLMMAYKKIIRKHPNSRLIITRNGKYLNELKDYSKEIKIDKNIIFTGDLSNPHIATSICDVYAHITYSDGLPNAMLEAMALGKPIVASNLFGIPEAIRNRKDGLLVNNDVNEIYHAVIELIKNEELRKKLGKNAKRTAEKKFTWEKTADSFIKICTE